MPVCMPVLIERDNNGYLNLKTNTPGATVHYSLNGGEEKIYTEPFEFISGGHVEAYAVSEQLGKVRELQLNFRYMWIVHCGKLYQLVVRMGVKRPVTQSMVI